MGLLSYSFQIGYNKFLQLQASDFSAKFFTEANRYIALDTFVKQLLGFMPKTRKYLDSVE